MQTNLKSICKGYYIMTELVLSKGSSVGLIFRYQQRQTKEGKKIHTTIWIYGENVFGKIQLLLAFIGRKFNNTS